MRFRKIEKLFFLIRSFSLTSNNSKRMVNVSLKNSDSHIYFDPLFVKFKKNIWSHVYLTHIFIRYLRVCKMIISLVFFFHFSKTLIFWAKNGVNEQKWPKIGKKLVRTLSEKQHVIWLWFLVCLGFLLFLVGLRHFFIFWKF